MMFESYPVLRGLVPYFFGILFANFYSVSSLNSLIIISSSSFCVVIVLMVVCKKLHSLRDVSIIAFFILFFLSGFTLTNIKNYSSSHFLCQENAFFQENR